ncbi:hypothetical protein BaRGS_00026623 [Batillaria attramentaria]|uniref:Uncharacterized protein n=1 Tax=Batillaria attramentaria TaxID=370345 RepID=A0ABD0K5M5_9CAEN
MLLGSCDYHTVFCAVQTGKALEFIRLQKLAVEKNRSRQQGSSKVADGAPSSFLELRGRYSHERGPAQKQTTNDQLIRAVGNSAPFSDF